MISISLCLKLTIIWLSQGTFCTEFPVTQESIEQIAEYQKLLIGHDVFNLMMKDSKNNVESNSSLSSSSSSEYDSCNSYCSIEDEEEEEEDYVDVDDENYSFKRSTIVYLMKILTELNNITTKVTKPFKRSKFLKFIDNLINLLDLFEKVNLSKKDDTFIIFKDKVKNVISNIEFIDKILPEAEKIVSEGYVIYGKKKVLKKILKKIRNLSKFYQELKGEFGEYNEPEFQDVNIDFTKQVEALNEFKKKLNENKIMIHNMNDENFEMQADDFLKSLLEVYKNLYKCLKSEFILLTVDFNILNYFWNSTSKCIEELVSYAKSFDLTKKALIILNTTCTNIDTSDKLIPPEEKM